MAILTDRAFYAGDGTGRAADGSRPRLHPSESSSRRSPWF